jgi:uncharacterized protein YcaQ
MICDLSAAEARAAAIRAQGLHQPPDRRSGQGVGPRRLGAALQTCGLVQIDSVNVLVRMHYLPLFSRLGGYPQGLLDAAAWGPKRTLFEYWGHEASLLPLELQPLLRWRMERASRGEGVWRRMAPYAGELRSVADRLLERVRRDGPMSASAFGEAGVGGWWGWSGVKTALEWLFFAGLLTTRTRRANFERVYDLPERTLPRAVLEAPTPTSEDSHRALLERSARALGVMTAADLRDYFRLSPADAKPRIGELIDSGVLQEVKIEGWPSPALAHPAALEGPRPRSAVLLAPFDPLIWARDRTLRLFAMRYRVEIYTPASQRAHGYYVLPFLLKDRLAARVDLKSDRSAGLLRVRSAHLEPGAPAAETAARLAEELGRLAAWLGLAAVVAEPFGSLAPALSAELAAGA